MEDKLYLCSGTSSLRCFLKLSKGYSCRHSLPHKKGNGCSDEICDFVNDEKVFCYPIDSENQNGLCKKTQVTY